MQPCRYKKLRKYHGNLGGRGFFNWNAIYYDIFSMRSQHVAVAVAGNGVEEQFATLQQVKCLDDYHTSPLLSTRLQHKSYPFNPTKGCKPGADMIQWV